MTGNAWLDVIEAEKIVEKVKKQLPVNAEKGQTCTDTGEHHEVIFAFNGVEWELIGYRSW